MLHAKRPFDDKPASACLSCGTPIAGTGFCLTCQPLSSLEGPDSWINFRWFTGPAAIARKRRLERKEAIQRGFNGVLALVTALVFFALFSHLKPVSAHRSDMFVAERHIAKTPLKIATNAVNIS